MPGFAGFFVRNCDAQSALALEQMHQSLAREPFDTDGSYLNAPAGFAVSWTSQQGSFSDCLPVWNETKDLCLVFCGEDFSEAGALDALQARGHVFNRGCADYIVHLFEEHGTAGLAKLNGSFSGVLLDLREKQAILFNDRFGLSRVYVHESAHGLFFSSEARAIFRIHPHLRDLDHRSLGEWFSCGCVLQNRTLFRSLSILPGGSMWAFPRDGALRKLRYFDPATWENQVLLGPEAYYEQLRETFPRVLRRYLKASRPVGMSLTGGLDGRMIMAWIDGGPGSLPCYTFNGPYHDCADLLIGRRIAAACGQSHQTIQIGDRFLSAFPALAEKTIVVSSGEMDVSGAVEIFANGLARQIAPIRLTGNYGSEIVRGNVAFKPGRYAEGLFAPELAQAMVDAEQTYGAERNCDRLSFIAFKQVPWHHHARLAAEQSQITMRSPFLDNDIVSLLFRAPADLRLAPAPSFRLIAAGNPQLARIPTDRGVVFPPIPVITHWRRRFEEFLINVEYAFDYGMPQSFAATVGRHLPAWGEHLFLGRQKFYHYRTWYQHELAPYVRDMLLDSRSRGRPWYRAGFVEEMVRSHTKGTRNYTSEIHRVLSLELIQRHLLGQ